jgi:hypothetical protein
MKFYHGTTRHRADQILTDGVDLSAQRSHDEGDFGWGFYVTRDLCRARAYGHVVLEVDLDLDRFAYIENPYFLEGFTHIEPKTDVERLFHGVAFDPETQEMRTCCNLLADHHMTAAQEIRDTFLSAGYAGITTGRDDGETVVFDVAGVLAVRPLE